MKLNTTKMCKWKLIILLFYLAIPCQAVVWSVLTHQMILGSDVTLICEANNSVCNNCVKRWYKGDKYQLLSIGNVSSDKTKYKASMDSDKLYLIIHNLTKDDLNIKYICSFGVHSHEKHLTIPFMLWSPTTSISTDKGFLIVDVYFMDIFEEPQCEFFLNYIDITSDTHNTKSKMIKNLYNISISLQHDMKDITCSSTLHIQCSDGYQTKYIFRETIRNSCNDAVYWSKEILPIFVIAVIYVVVLIIVVCYCSYRQVSLNIEDDKHRFCSDECKCK